MEKVTGRTDDMIILRGVNVFPTRIEEIILTVGEFSPHFQIVLTREGRMDQMEIRVEACPEAPADARVAAAARLEHIVKNTVGVTAHVSDPDGIERSASKARQIIDHRPRG
jgi:phenylacetate-CoA ligase